MSVETDLITAAYDRLNGEDSHGQTLQHDGSTVEAYTGSAPASAEGPLVIIGRPRTRGSETLDGVETPEVRLQVKVHTTHPEGKINEFQPYEIAQAAHDLLEAAPLQVGDKEPYIPEPDKQPVGYEKGDREAADVNLQYRWPSL